MYSRKWQDGKFEAELLLRFTKMFLAVFFFLTPKLRGEASSSSTKLGRLRRRDKVLAPGPLESKRSTGVLPPKGAITGRATYLTVGTMGTQSDDQVLPRTAWTAN
jgi:hypothetical protein